MTEKTQDSEQIPVNIVGSSTFGRYNKISSEMTLNMFISDEWLVNFAGYKRVLQLFESGRGRGIFRSIRGDFLIVVVNSAVYQVNANLTYLFIGSLATNETEVTIDENLNQQICIVDGTYAYIYNWSGTVPRGLTIQSLAAGLIPNYVCYHNNNFLFGNANNAGSGANWYVYANASATTISLITGGEFSLQTKPDNALAITRIPGQSANVLVMGESVCEIWTQIQGIVAYRRNTTASVDYGVISTNTIDSADHYIAWVGVNETNSPVIMVFSKQGITPISTDGIDHALNNVRYPAQSTADFVRIDGHLFYQVTFYNKADNLTLVYDFNTEQFFNLSDQYKNYHPARQYVYFNNNIYFISLNNGSMYLMDTAITVIDENINGSDPTEIYEIPRERICANLKSDDGDKAIFKRFTFTMEQGTDPKVSGASLDVIQNLVCEDLFPESGYPMVTEWGFNIVDETSWSGGTAYIAPYQPRVDLSVSYDAGITWSAAISRGLNPIGYRKNIINWNRLGSGNVLTLKLQFLGTSRFIAYNGVLEV